MVETRSGRRFAVLFIAAAFLVLLLGRWLKPVDHVALTVSAPFTAAISGVANWAGDGISSVTNGPRLQQEVNSLQKQNAKLTQQVITDAEQRHENAVYRRMLGFHDKHTHLELVVSRVIGGDVNGGLAPSVVINRGTQDGLRVGMTVLDQNGYFIGSIVDVWTNASRVQEILSPSSSVGAYDLRSRATGLVEGQYGARPQLNLVVASANLQQGDLILTSGQCLLFPRGLLLGQVVNVQHSNVNVYQTATIQPAVDFRNLEFTMVVRNFLPSLPTGLVCKQ